MAEWKLPERGVVWWPVGNGDAITVVIDADTVLQVDLNHRVVAEDEADNRVPVVDRLIEVLPIVDGCATLTVLAISHHDEDHCSGFSYLLEHAVVEELWVTLRSFVEVEDGEELSDAAQAVYDETCRRRQAEIEAAQSSTRAAAGDRLRIIGNADLLDNEDWQGFPAELLTSAGGLVPTINDVDRGDDISVFVHTPFRSDTEDNPSRNSSSMGIHISLPTEQSTPQRLLLLGDLEHEQIEAFVTKTEENENDDFLTWDVLLAPHHCSRNAVRTKDGDDWVDAQSADDLERYAADNAIVVVSARSFEDIDDSDTDPPHVDAREVYESIVGTEAVHTTSDYAKGSDSEPLTITLDVDGTVTVLETRSQVAARWRSVSAVTSATEAIEPGEQFVRGGDRPFA